MEKKEINETKKENKTNDKKQNFYKDFNFSFDIKTLDIDDWERVLDLTSSPFLWSGIVNKDTDAKPLWKVQRDFEVEKAVQGYGFHYADLAEIKRIAKKIDARIAISIVGDKNVEYRFSDKLNVLTKTFIFCIIFEGAPYYGRPLKIEKKFSIGIFETKAGKLQLDYTNGAIETYAMRYMYNSFLSIAGSIDPEQLEVNQNTFAGAKTRKETVAPKVYGKLKDVDPKVFELLEKSPFKNLFINNLKDELLKNGIKFNQETLLKDRNLWGDISLEKFESIINNIKKNIK